MSSDFQSTESNSFPIEKQLPDLRNLIRHESAIIERSDGFVVGMVLAVLSTIFLPRYMVRTFWGAEVPISLYFQTLAPSSSRKSGIAKVLYSIMENRIKEIENSTRNHNKRVKLLHDSWRLKKDVAKKSYEAAVRKGNDGANEMSKYVEILAEEPTTRPIRSVIHSKFTPAAFWDDIDSNKGVAVIFSDEGSAFYKNILSTMAGDINTGWSCLQLRKHTLKGGLLVIDNPRIAMHIAIQSDIFFDLDQKLHKDLLGNGFYARLNLAEPLPFIENNGYQEFETNQTEYESFIEYLKREVENSYPLTGPYDGLLVVLTVSDEVDLKMRALSVMFDHESRPGGIYEECASFAGKATEMIYRVMGILHNVEGREGTILKVDVFEAAFEIVKWYLHEHWRLIIKGRRPSMYDICAERIIKHMKERQGRSFNLWESQTQLRHNVSCIGKDRVFSDEVLTLLINKGLLVKRNAERNYTLTGTYFNKGGRKRTEYALSEDVSVTSTRWG